MTARAQSPCRRLPIVCVLCVCFLPKDLTFFSVLDLLTEKLRSSGGAVTVSTQCALHCLLAFYCAVISLLVHLSLYQVKGQCREIKLQCREGGGITAFLRNKGLSILRSTMPPAFIILAFINQLPGKMTLPVAGLLRFFYFICEI